MFCFRQGLKLATVKDECCRRLQLGFLYSQLRLLCTGLCSAALFRMKTQRGMTFISSSVHQRLSDVSLVSLRIANSEQPSDQTDPAFAAIAAYIYLFINLFIYLCHGNTQYAAGAVQGNSVPHFYFIYEE